MCIYNLWYSIIVLWCISWDVSIERITSIVYYEVWWCIINVYLDVWCIYRSFNRVLKSHPKSNSYGFGLGRHVKQQHWQHPSQPAPALWGYHYSSNLWTDGYPRPIWPMIYGCLWSLVSMVSSSHHLITTASFGTEPTYLWTALAYLHLPEMIWNACPKFLRIGDPHVCSPWCWNSRGIRWTPPGWYPSHAY